MSQPNQLPAYLRVVRSWWRSLLLLLAGILLVGLLLVPNGLSLARPPSVAVMSQDELLAVLGEAPPPLILDVRSTREYESGHVPGALHIHYQDLPDRLDELRAQHPDSIVVYCEVGVRATLAERILNQADFANVLHLDGDMRAWRSRDLPTEQGS